MTEEPEYKYKLYVIENNMIDTYMGIECTYEFIPQKMKVLAELLWGDRWDFINQPECLVPLYIRNIDTGECLIAK